MDMRENTDRNLGLNIDLSFHEPNHTFLHKDLDGKSRQVLSSRQDWEKYLIEWIQYVRSRKEFSCPDVLRSATIVSMGLRFTDDETIALLNSSWRNQSGSTDVLSFRALDDQTINCDVNCVEIEDIIVSSETAERQAKEYGHSLTYELKWLVSHGLLHLLGWDHPTVGRLKEMISCQEQLLSINGNISHSSH